MAQRTGTGINVSKSAINTPQLLATNPNAVKEYRVFELANLDKHPGMPRYFVEKQRQAQVDAKITGYDLTNNPAWDIDTKVEGYKKYSKDSFKKPDYAGGVYSVLGIYKNAIPRISINKLVAILDNLDFIYPYHQAIGFYLEKAGVSDNKLRLLSNKEKEFDFYLTYEISEKQYNSKWKLYHPKGM